MRRGQLRHVGWVGIPEVEGHQRGGVAWCSLCELRPGDPAVTARSTGQPVILHVGVAHPERQRGEPLRFYA